MSFAEVGFWKLFMLVIIFFYVIQRRRQGRLELWEELWIFVLGLTTLFQMVFFN